MKCCKLLVVALIALSFGLSPARAEDGPEPVIIAGGGLAEVTSSTHLLGMTLEEAKKTDFFTFFHLKQTTTTPIGQGGFAEVLFKPESEQFAKLVTVKVLVSPKQDVVGMSLHLDRTFVDHRVNGLFARDIAKSMLLATLPEKDVAQKKDLVLEVQSALGVRSSELPATPTAGYETYLGQREHDIEGLGETILCLANHKTDAGVELQIGVFYRPQMIKM